MIKKFIPLLIVVSFSCYSQESEVVKALSMTDFGVQVKSKLKEIAKKYQPENLEFIGALMPAISGRIDTKDFGIDETFRLRYNWKENSLSTQYTYEF